MDMETLEETRVAAGRFTEALIAFLPSLISALVILIIGLFLAGWLSRGVGNALGRSVRLDPTVRAPIVAIVKYLVVIMTLVIALGQVGVQMTSLLAILGAAGLAIGLALQGTLTNIAAGIMLLWLRPFRVGDYIETGAFSGTVREIGLFVSHLETFDGLFVFAPNSTLWNVWLRNHSRAAARTLAWTIVLKRETPYDEARDILMKQGRLTRNREVFLDELAADTQTLVLRAQVEEGTISNAQHRMAEDIRKRFSDRFGPEGEPLQIKRLLPADADPSRFMDRAEAPKAHAQLVNHRAEAPKQGTTTTPATPGGAAPDASVAAET
ncbi:mechanosensitive ion channel family protein [Aureimonas populi]|uniref:Small-conductance mechanosensitive channel n=1 Tax=Aureimonas populi TaxID=1701758 RepID=A0ABW5CQ89_9HYPH|nr:mechanosensitive ion channel domain-containing protein [Aureimonas populi]